jgi:hypothetical protein
MTHKKRRKITAAPVPAAASAVLSHHPGSYDLADAVDVVTSNISGVSVVSTEVHIDIRALEESIGSGQWRLEWLKNECSMLEQKITSLDDLSFRIKGWAIATWSGITTVGLTKSDWRIALLAAIVPMLFMVIDASYKRYQICFIERTREIMKFLNDRSECARVHAPSYYGFPIYDLLGIHGRGRRQDPLHQEWGGIRGPLLKASVTLPYWIILATSIAVTVLLLTG